MHTVIPKYCQFSPKYDYSKFNFVNPKLRAWKKTFHSDCFFLNLFSSFLISVFHRSVVLLLGALLVSEPKLRGTNIKNKTMKNECAISVWWIFLALEVCSLLFQIMIKLRAHFRIRLGSRLSHKRNVNSILHMPKSFVFIFTNQMK